MMNGKTPYLLDVLQPQEFAIFCGAGISKNSGLPLANELKQYILEKLPIENKDMDEIMNSNLPFEAFMETISENTDISKLLEIFQNGEPNINHILIGRLAKKDYLKIIFTTNFDLLIEKALENEGLKRSENFEVYSDEEQFSGIDFENIENGIRIFKIHGSVDNKDSIRTTMKAVASKTLSDKRMNVIRYLFSMGRHKKVLILGYSCSDEFDITPQIQNIEENQKEIIFVEHWEEGKEMEDLRIKERKNPFKTFPGKRIKCNTDDCVRDLWDSFKETIGEYRFVKSQLEWKESLNSWGEKIDRYVMYHITGQIFSTIADVNKAIKYHNSSLEIAKTIGNKAQEASSFINLGNAYRNLSDFTKAIEYYEKALGITKKLGDKAIEVACYVNLGIAYGGLGDFTKAIDYFKKPLGVSKEIGDERIEGMCYTNLGIVYDELGDFKRAIEYHEKALKIAEGTGDKKGEALCWTNLGSAHRGLGDFEKAVEYSQKGLEIAKAVGDRVGEAVCYGNLGIAYNLLGDFTKAIDYFEESIEITEEIGKKEN